MIFSLSYVKYFITLKILLYIIVASRISRQDTVLSSNPPKSYIYRALSGLLGLICKVNYYLKFYLNVRSLKLL